MVKAKEAIPDYPVDEEYQYPVDEEYQYPVDPERTPIRTRIVIETPEPKTPTPSPSTQTTSPSTPTPLPSNSPTILPKYITPTNYPNSSPKAVQEVTLIETAVPAISLSNSDELKTRYEDLVKIEYKEIKQTIYKIDQRFNIVSISALFTDLSKGEVCYKASFKFKDGWNFSRINAYLYFETLISNDNKTVGICFKGIDKIQITNPSKNMSDDVLQFFKKVKSEIIGKNKWHENIIPKEYNILDEEDLKNKSN